MDGNHNKRSKKAVKKPPEMSPYIFTILLAGFGLWCFYDGWITTNPEMAKHALFNRVVSLVLLPWAVYDYLKLKKYEKKNAADKKLVSSDCFQRKIVETITDFPGYAAFFISGTMAMAS